MLLFQTSSLHDNMFVPYLHFCNLEIFAEKSLPLDLLKFYAHETEGKWFTYLGKVT